MYAQADQRDPGEQAGTYWAGRDVLRLLNHVDGADVTAGYLVVTPERLREPMQRITDYVLKHAGLKPTAAVIPIRAGGHV